MEDMLNPLASASCGGGVTTHRKDANTIAHGGSVLTLVFTLSLSFSFFLLLLLLLLQRQREEVGGGGGRGRFLPLQHVPGPAAARFTSLYRVYLVWSGRGPARLRELHRRYGPVVRTGPAHVSVADPSALTVVYGFGGGFVKVLFFFSPCVAWFARPLYLSPSTPHLPIALLGRFAIC